MSTKSDRVNPKVWRIAATCSCGPMMSGLDSTMVNVSLDSLGKVFNAPLGTIQWVTSAYLLSLALALPLSGWLMDRIGARRIFLFCFTVFVLGSVLSSMAGTVEILIASRVLQGIAGGLMAPMMQMMMARHAGHHMARVIGVAAMPVMIGQMLGPSLGGFLLSQFGWRAIFLVNVPVGAIAIGFALYALPKDDATILRRLDLPGFALLSPGLALLLLGLATASHGHDGLPYELIISALLLAGFVIHALRAPATALIDLRLFTGRTFRAAAMTQFLSNAIGFGGQLLLPLYFLNVRAASPALTGALMMPMALGMFVSLPVMGRLSERFGARMISGSGAAIALLGTLPFAFAGPETPLAVLCVALFVRGFGVGSITIPSAAAAYASVPRDSLSSATTAINICQRFGGPVGTTALALFLQHRLQADLPESAYIATFWLLAALAGCGVLAASRLPGPRRTNARVTGH